MSRHTISTKPLPRIGVNIDHIATVRNARGGSHPDPVAGAWAAIQGGADGITAHLREDRRHMRDNDMERLQALCDSANVPLNMEMAATNEMLEIALSLRPHAVCIVPEKREERTTEGGLDVVGLNNTLTPLITKLRDNGSRVSLFIEADRRQIEAAARTSAQVVEFHTGAYAHSLDAGDKEKSMALLDDFKKGAVLAQSLGLEVHFGHGLTYENVGPIAAIPECMELNIGHFIIGEAIFLGLSEAIKQMREIVEEARQRK
ncbi:pyridoxine 5'-phosphate synthase [Litorimonas taeanensis]|uniref:Pyridoxine 5'-phosphate synthase n=1 Tax=Litorimonas taeanensis TaxID=568099 RepID=A0A420WKK9_9PROT|nr:pyridoxine 5'-phosphate synthase [Litorimonas taeanensis]RKQ71452.1 pyridoxine 5'-phosphate synthase [Litorimonas taeanensis]